jgi:ubiquinol-cytochrome c reductase cytochrome c subunit
VRPSLAAALVTLAATSCLVALRPVEAQTGRVTEDVEGGRQLFLEGCASCHGADGRGVDEPDGDVRGPSLEDAGEALAYYYLSTGRMPLANAEEVAVRKEPAYDDDQIRQLVAYVGTLGDGPALPVLPDEGTLPAGGELYRGNCAPCHSAGGIGGPLSYGQAAPSLRPAEPLEIASAIRSGPGEMPRFGEDVLSDQEVADIVEHVTDLGDQDDQGGLSLGGVGPVAEGFVIWVFGIGGVLALAFWIGRKGHPS